MSTPIDSISHHGGRCYTSTSLEAEVDLILKQLGVSYSAQYPTRTGFILDFAVQQSGRRIAIEVDGPFHDDSRRHSRDAFRTLLLKREGWEVIRIHHSQMDHVKEIIQEALNGKLFCKY